MQNNNRLVFFVVVLTSFLFNFASLLNLNYLSHLSLDMEIPDFQLFICVYTKQCVH